MCCLFLSLQHRSSHSSCFLKLISTRSKERNTILRRFKCQIFHFLITTWIKCYERTERRRPIYVQGLKRAWLVMSVHAPRRYTSDFCPPLLSCVYVYVKFGLDWQVLVAEDAVSRALGPPGQTPNPRPKSKQITKEASKTSDFGTRLLAFSLHFKT